MRALGRRQLAVLFGLNLPRGHVEHSAEPRPDPQPVQDSGAVDGQQLWRGASWRPGLAASWRRCAGGSTPRGAAGCRGTRCGNHAAARCKPSESLAWPLLLGFSSSIGLRSIRQQLLDPLPGPSQSMEEARLHSNLAFHRGRTPLRLSLFAACVRTCMHRCTPVTGSASISFLRSVAARAG